MVVGNGRPTLEGLLGTKVGHQGKNWGVFGKVRPGFIYYENVWTGGEKPKFDSLSRFSLDAGGHCRSLSLTKVHFAVRHGHNHGEISAGLPQSSPLATRQLAIPRLLRESRELSNLQFVRNSFLIILPQSSAALSNPPPKQLTDSQTTLMPELKKRFIFLQFRRRFGCGQIG